MSLPTAAYGIGSAVPPVRRNRPSQVAGTRCPTVEMVLGSPRQARLSNPDSLPDVASPAKSRPRWQETRRDGRAAPRSTAVSAGSGGWSCRHLLG